MASVGLVKTLGPIVAPALARFAKRHGPRLARGLAGRVKRFAKRTYRQRALSVATKRVRRRRSRVSAKQGRVSQLKFRSGKIAAGGGRGLSPASATYNFVVADQVRVTGTTAGDTMSLSCGNYSDPGFAVAATFSVGGTGGNRPSGHAQAIALGYDRSMILAKQWVFHIRTASGQRNYLFAYKFSIDSSASMIMTAGTVTIDNFKDMRQSKGWTYKLMSSEGVGSGVNKDSAIVKVDMKSYVKLAKTMLKPGALELNYPSDYQAALNTTRTLPSADIFLHFLIMDIDGVALDAASIIIDMTIYGKVRVSREVDIADIIDEAVQVS